MLRGTSHLINVVGPVATKGGVKGGKHAKRKLCILKILITLKKNNLVIK